MSSQQSNQAVFDIAIVGGAMAGATMVIAATKAMPNAKIAVIEAVAPSDEHPGFDSRAIALSAGSVQYLDSLDLWSGFKENAAPITHIHVSDRGHLGRTRLHANDYGLNALGQVVELHQCGAYFYQQLQQLAQVTLFCPNQVEQIERDQNWAYLTLNNQQTIQTKLVIAADGANSPLREMVGLPVEISDYEQTAVITNIQTNSDLSDYAWERFTEHGPIALLPLNDNRLSLVWCVPPAQAKALLQFDDSSFIAELQHSFGEFAGKIERIGQRFAYPLKLFQCPSVISHRLALVGNAAHLLHPIAGQGFNLGLRDIADLANVLSSQPDDPGSYNVLAQYQQYRKSDLNQTIHFTNTLVRTFSTSALPMVVSRNVGLSVMRHLPWTKYSLVAQALGLFSSQR